MHAVLTKLRLTSRLSGVIARNCNTNIVSTPPRVKISTAEQFFSLFCLGAAIMGPPMYFAPRFKIYANRPT
ncbi:hypothetical protein EAI_13790 [Harpegnathos saltator]|uniref:Uncharacterized protein n=1 Tax=Harpegnathos saltator TaxID=610380 RepID=E2BX99_HARSA|nr:hypothetical protein EAI_13790 [Harpegnathos saltator]